MAIGPGPTATGRGRSAESCRYSGHYEGDRLREAAETLPEYGIELVEFGDCGPVAAVAEELDVTVSDAAYVAQASTNEGTAYTADDRLLEAVAETEYDPHLAHVRNYARGEDS